MSEPTTPPENDSLYTIEGSNIFRKGEHISSYDPDTQFVTAVEGHEKYLTASKKFLSDEGIEWKNPEPPEKDEDEEKETPVGFVPPVPLHDPSGDPPATDPKFGNLTPVYMVWRLQQGEEAFRENYDGKLTPIGDFKNGVIDFDALTKTYLGK